MHRRKRHCLPTQQEKEFSYTVVTGRLKKKHPQLLAFPSYNSGNDFLNRGFKIPERHGCLENLLRWNEASGQRFFNSVIKHGIREFWWVSRGFQLFESWGLTFLSFQVSIKLSLLPDAKACEVLTVCTPGLCKQFRFCTFIFLPHLKTCFPSQILIYCQVFLGSMQILPAVWL